MILVDNFRIFVLVVGLCGTLIHPAESAAKCDKAGQEDACTDATHPCGIDSKTGAGTGCVADAGTGCPAAALPPDGASLCEGDKCCCNGVEKCNDIAAHKDLVCKDTTLATALGDKCTKAPVPGLKCHGDKDSEIECKEKENCGVHSDGTNFGCYDASVCLAAPTATLACDAADLTKHCCCFGEKCNSHAAACAEETLKGKLTDCGGASPSPPTGGPTPAPTGEPGDSGSERSAVTLSVGSLVAIASVGGLSHRISSGA